MSTREFAIRIVREIVAIKSYSFWKDVAFRKTIAFEKLGVKKQDIIFNELQVNSLVYVLYFLEEQAKKSRGSQSVVYRNIKEYMKEAFLDVMVDTKIDARQLVFWEKLIDLRVREYDQEIKVVMKESASWRTFSGQDNFLRETWGRIVTLSLSTARNIENSRAISPKDPLWRELRRFLISLEVELLNVFKEEDVNELRVLN